MPTVSLVLGAGGARGYAHIGVIEELEQRGWLTALAVMQACVVVFGCASAVARTRNVAKP